MKISDVPPPWEQRGVWIEPLEARQLLSAVRIMPLGDSITEGWIGHDRVSYRFWLWKKLQHAGYDFDFVGTRSGIASGSPIWTDWDQDHQGTTGQRADEMIPLAGGWVAATQADVVLLHAGTSDIVQGQSTASTASELGQIIDSLRVGNPNITVFLAKIIPAVGHDEAINALNKLIPGIVSFKNTPESPVFLTDQFAGFDAQLDTWDGAHPNWAGERKMANKWFAGLAAYLPAPPPTPPPAVTYLSDLDWTSMTNGSGPVEKDQSVGFNGADDGGALWLNGVTYPKGLGTHAHSEVTYALDGQYARFRALIGIDDGAGTFGSAVFEVYADDVRIFQSGVMTANSPTQPIDLDVAGKSTLRLVVNNAGDGDKWDHGNWAMARLTTQPTVSASSFEFETAPHKLQFTFRRDVSSSIDPSDLMLENLTASQTVPSESIAVSYDTTTNTATFVFPGFVNGILPDGYYRATLMASGVTDGAGNPMPEDHVFHFHFLRGDANHDGTVNLLDFDILVLNFGLSGRTFSQGDFNYDGITTLRDFNVLALRYGISLFPSAAGRAKVIEPSHVIDLIEGEFPMN